MINLPGPDSAFLHLFICCSMESAGDRAAQTDEAEVLKSIYGEDCVFQDEHSCEILVHPLEDDVVLPPLRIGVYFPNSYPSTSAPIVEMEAPWLQEDQRWKLSEELHKVFQESAGNVIIFTWVEWIKEQSWLWDEARNWLSLHKDTVGSKTTNSFDNLDEIRGDVHSGAIDSAQVSQRKNVPSLKVDKTLEGEQAANESEELDKILGITHGAPFTEKRSTFQAHLVQVNSLDQVETVMEALLRNRKIAGATHNIMAYRINIPEKNTVLQDYDDDGETAAGGRLLHLLQIVDATNVVVVVSRWFGGILLGPDRFKHINNAARSLLNSSGFIKGAGQSGSIGDKQKSQSKATTQKGKRR